MEEELAQSRFELSNLRTSFETIENEWTLSEDKCHNLQLKCTQQAETIKRINYELEKFRRRETDLANALEISEETLLISQANYNRKKFQLDAEIKRSESDALKLEKLKEDKQLLEKCVDDLNEKIIYLKSELDSSISNRNELLRNNLEANNLIQQFTVETKMLQEIISELRAERDAANNERLNLMINTPKNLFLELAACEKSGNHLDLQGTPRLLDFSSCETSEVNTNLGTELLMSDNNDLYMRLKKKDSLIKSLRKKIKLERLKSQRYKQLRKRQKDEWKGQTDGDESEAHIEESVVTVVVKDGVQSGQPRVRIIETISIATQTDRIAILAAAVQTQAVGNESLVDSLSESDEESSESRLELVAAFTEHRPSPTDYFEMDMYRSCRKLSVLPEEEGDEGGLYRNSSVRSNLSARLAMNLSQSVDDVTTTGRCDNNRTSKGVSCADILLTSKTTPYLSISETDDLPVNTNELSSPNSFKVSLLDPADAFHQPHSFDSYLDPQKIPPNLPRQISDPTQNIGCAPALIRRGSYVKRPRSTCRPLTLTCDGNNSESNERVPKVRFDLTEKEADDPVDVKEIILVSKLKPTKNVSRFRVEPVDEKELNLESSPPELRKRPPLIHSVVYKKSVLQELSPVGDVERCLPQVLAFPEEVLEAEEPYFEPCLNGNYLMDDIYPCKRRKQSDVSCASIESSEEIDIVQKSIRLHENGQYIVMRDLSNDTSSDTDIPYIDAEELAGIMAEISKTTQTEVSCFDTATFVMSPMSSTENPDLSSPSSSCIGAVVTPSSSSSGTFCTAASELTPLTEEPPPKSGIGLSKSPTVLKNLASFESYDSPDVKHRVLSKNILEEDDELSETSDTITYVTVKSDPLLFSSDCDSDTYVTVKSDLNTLSEGDSDTYVTIKSDRSSLERMHSDVSEHSNSPYNTPPDTSSASFCTPPDTYSPLFIKANRYLRMHSGSSTPSPRGTRSSSPAKILRNSQNSNTSSFNYDTPPAVSPFSSPAKSGQNSNETEAGIDPNFPVDRRKSEASFISNQIIFDSPKLEFYETNDSVENLEAFLESEEGLCEEDNVPIKRNSLDSATDGRFTEKRMKRHPPLSRQNSTEEYIYLEPQDSSLNLSEEISSPSTTPDTSNKTVIFKNKPLTVSNTIDLDDDDFPISESEIIINLNGSQTEIVEIPLMHTCRSEPCIPSMGKSTLARLNRQSCSMSEDAESCNYPAIVISNVSSESEESSSLKIGKELKEDKANTKTVTETSQPRPPCPLPEAS